MNKWRDSNWATVSQEASYEQLFCIKLVWFQAILTFLANECGQLDMQFLGWGTLNRDWLFSWGHLMTERRLSPSSIIRIYVYLNLVCTCHELIILQIFRSLRKNLCWKLPANIPDHLSRAHFAKVARQFILASTARDLKGCEAFPGTQKRWDDPAPL